MTDSTGALDRGRIWTPYVGSALSDSLKVYLNAGDGILVRLMDTLPTVPMQMMVAFVLLPITGPNHGCIHEAADRSQPVP